MKNKKLSDEWNVLYSMPLSKFLFWEIQKLEPFDYAEGNMNGGKKRTWKA